MREASHLAIVVAVCAVSACVATVSKQQLAGVSERSLEPDIVDIRGIWEDSGLNRDEAITRGLDPARIELPRKIKDQPPVYPPDAIQSRTTGTVTLDCIIDAAGRARDCRIVSGPYPLRAAASAAIAQRRWEPLRVDGTVRRAAALLTVTFVLRSPGTS
jgi:TonB family protein